MKERVLNVLNYELEVEILSGSERAIIEAETTILREGQYVKVIPLVISGLIKVFTRYEDRELLLYYIQPGESCIMSFSASLKNTPSQVYAVTEEDTDVLLMPIDKMEVWSKEHRDINMLFFEQYNKRYSDLLETIQHALFDKMDQRVFHHLLEKQSVTGNNPLKISHKRIANELGTAREVVSRVIKKLEHEGKVKQRGNLIEIIESGD